MEADEYAQQQLEQQEYEEHMAALAAAKNEEPEIEHDHEQA